MFDTEVFINEIQTRPPLWNVKLKDYSNRDIKGKLWIEVSSTMVQNWDELNNSDKNKEVKELQKKWKSIRDAFTREVRLQKLPSGSGKAKRKRYIYFDQLLFLLDTLEERPTLTNVNIEGTHSDGETQNEEHESADTMSMTGDVAKQISLNQKVTPIRRTVKKNANTFEQEVLQHIKSVKPNEKDDDELFLLSLLPMFKKLDVRTKLWARMKFMETLQQAIDFGTPMPSPSISNASNIPARPTFSNHTYPSSNYHGHLQLGNIISENIQMTGNIPAYPPFFQNNPTFRRLANSILAHPPMSNNISMSNPQENITKVPQPSPASSTSRSSAVEPPADSPTYTELSSSHSQDSTIFDIYD